MHVCSEKDNEENHNEGYTTTIYKFSEILIIYKTNLFQKSKYSFFSEYFFPRDCNIKESKRSALRGHTFAPKAVSVF